MGQPRIKRYLVGGSAALAATLAALCGTFAARPDYGLRFERDVPTDLPAETLDLSMHTVSNWPKWFFQLAKAERIDVAGRPFPLGDQVVQKGAVIRLELEPHPGERRGSFQLLVTVTDYVPRRALALRLDLDRSGKLDALVRGLEWRIELEPRGAGLMIHGTETALTKGLRARVLGALAERVLMNQLFYPDLMALGQFTQPVPPNPYPAFGQ